MKKIVINVLGSIIMVVLAVIILLFVKENYFKTVEEITQEETAEENKEQVEENEIDWEYPVDIGEGEGCFGIFVSNGNKQGLDNSRFEVTDSDGSKIASLGSNEKGLTGIKGLEKGKYYIKQTYVKDEYEMPDTTYEIEITDNEKEFNKIVYNEIKDKGDYLIVLLDDEKNPIEGAQFEMYKNDEKVLTLTTDEKGLARAENLGLGTYYIKQISTKEDYKVSDKTYEYTVEEEALTKRDDIINEKGE